MGTYMQGAQKAGSTPMPSRDAGFVVYEQTIDVQAASNATKDFTAYLPDGAQLVDVLLDTTTLHTSASATLSGGTAAGGTELWPAASVLSLGRVRPTFTGPQLLAMKALPHVSGQSDTPVYMRLTLGATVTSVGLTKVILQYAIQLN